jgi:hypothetical protein
MGAVVPLSPMVSPFSTATWPIAGDAPDLRTIVEDQAKTITDKAALIDAYQGWLNIQQSPGPVITAIGNSVASTSLTISANTGAVVIGSAVTVAGMGFSPALQIVAQSSGPVGGAGVYLTNQPTSLVNAALTLVAPGIGPTPTGNGTSSGTPATTLTVSAVTGGSIVIGAVVAGSGVPAGCTIVAQTGGTAGGNGVYTTSVATTASSAALTFTPPPLTSAWPTPNDAPTLNTIMQDQTAILRNQTALIQQYQQLLNDSQTPPPPTGP